MKILQGTVRSVTVSEVKHHDCYLGEYYTLIPTIKIANDYNKVHPCRYHAPGLTKSSVDYEASSIALHLNQKINNAKSALEKELNHYFSINDQVIVIGLIKRGVFVIHAFYNQTKNRVELKEIPSIFEFIALFFWFNIFAVTPLHFENSPVNIFRIYVVVAVISFLSYLNFLLKMRKAKQLNKRLLQAKSATAR